MAKYTHLNVLDGHGWNVEECLENGNQSTQRFELKSKFWYICDVKSYVRKFKMLSWSETW